MNGRVTIKINQETMIAALQKYFTTVVFDASQIATVVDVEEEENDDGDKEYVVSIDASVELRKP